MYFILRDTKEKVSQFYLKLKRMHLKLIKSGKLNMKKTGYLIFELDSPFRVVIYIKLNIDIMHLARS